MPDDEIDPINEKLRSAQEVAELFEVTHWTVRVWVKKGRMKCNKIGNRMYFTEQHIRDYANNRWPRCE